MHCRLQPSSGVLLPSSHSSPSSTVPSPHPGAVVEVVSVIESVVSRVVDDSVVVVSDIVVSTVVGDVAIVEVVGSTGTVLPVLGSVVVVGSVLVEVGVVLVVSDTMLVTSTPPLSSPLAQPNGLNFPQLLFIPQPSSAK